MGLDKTHRKYKALSLFSGAGGLNLGFHETGLIENGCCYEFNPVFSDTLRLNRNKLAESIEDNSGPVILQEDLGNNASLERVIQRWKGTDIVHGGPPCQSFS